MSVMVGPGPGTDGIQVVGDVIGWVVLALIALVIVGFALRPWRRRRRAEALAAAMVARDKQRELLQLESLRGIPDLAPFETYTTEWEWEEDLQRKTFMGYKVLELNRFPHADGSDNEVQVQWQGDPRDLQRAKRELQRAERQSVGRTPI